MLFFLTTLCFIYFLVCSMVNQHLYRQSFFTWQVSSGRVSLVLSICAHGCPICTAVLGFFLIIPQERNCVTLFKIQPSQFDGLEVPPFFHGEQLQDLMHPKQNIQWNCSRYKGFFCYFLNSANRYFQNLIFISLFLPRFLD